MSREKSRKIIADTSIWIAYFSGLDEKLRKKFDQYLDKDQLILTRPVKMELISGIRESEIFRVERVISAVSSATPDYKTWDLVEAFIKKALKGGLRFGIMDLLIAANAKQEGARLWSLDPDFKKMAKIGLVELVE